MKKFLCIICLCLLFFSSCQRTEAADVTPKELADRLARSLQDEMPFTAADDDYIESNFEGLSGRGVVYFGNDEDVCEFGIFSLSGTDMSTAKTSIRAYIEAEAEALSSMAQLYPSEDMQERLDCYLNAYIGNGKGYVYYLIMEQDEMAKARSVLERALNA